MGTLFRPRRSLLPLAVWAMTAVLAYTAGKRRSDRRKGGAPGRARLLGRRASARRAETKRSQA